MNDTFEYQWPDLAGQRRSIWRKRLEDAVRDGREIAGDAAVKDVLAALIAQLDIRRPAGRKPGPIPAGVLLAAKAAMRHWRENEARVARGQAPLPQLTQGQLARRAGMSKQAFAKWHGDDNQRWLQACYDACLEVTYLKDETST